MSTTISIEPEATKAAERTIERGGRARWLCRRGSAKRGFYYEDCGGRRVSDAETLGRIRALVVPPAWRCVRVSPSPRSRVQAVGIDAAGRVQYRYNAAFAARQAKRKYDKLERFATVLPTLRRKTNEHLSCSEALSRERVLAAVVRLISDLYFRVGSEKSVRRYRTFGITTLRSKHLTIRTRGRLEFQYVGKHHIRQRKVLVDAPLAELLREIKAVRGARLFNWLDDEGRAHPVSSRDVNAYIKAHSSPEFSAKDFRTWGGSLLAAVALAEMGVPETVTERKRNVVRAIARVAERLGNTPTVCRSCYIHPTVIAGYLDGTTIEGFRPRRERFIRREQPDYEPEEVALLRMLRASRGPGAANDATRRGPSIRTARAA